MVGALHHRKWQTLSIRDFFFFPLENQLLKIYHYNIWRIVSLKHYELWMLRQNLIWPLGTQTLR